MDSKKIEYVKGDFTFTLYGDGTIDVSCKFFKAVRLLPKEVEEILRMRERFKTRGR